MFAPTFISDNHDKTGVLVLQHYLLTQTINWYRMVAARGPRRGCHNQPSLFCLVTHIRNLFAPSFIRNRLTKIVTGLPRFLSTLQNILRFRFGNGRDQKIEIGNLNLEFLGRILS
jgi:hypothetical protein